MNNSTSLLLCSSLLWITSHQYVLTPFTDQIQKLQRNGSSEHEFFIFWVPRRTLVCDKILEEQGILGDTSVSEFPLYFLPLEKDVLSLELEESFSDLYLVSEMISS